MPSTLFGFGSSEDLAWNDAPEFMVPIIKRLINEGLKVWIYRY
jgi:serine carboxypeptidase-like clade II